MQTPRFFPLLRWPRQCSAVGVRAATLGFCLMLLAALACDEKALTETPALSDPTEIGVNSSEVDGTVQVDASAMAVQLPLSQAVSTSAPAPAFRINQTGTGPNAIFRITNTTNSQTALAARTAGAGAAGLFEATQLDNPSSALVVRTKGTGPALHAVTNNNGDFVEAVGTFEAAVNGTALFASANSPIYYALHARGRPLAGLFQGDVTVDGTLTKSGGSFRIDHPLDPDHKYLSHSFVESPDMMNVYNGNVTLDASGRATVELPAYFEALNRDFRYQLTAIGAPGPNLYIAEGVKQNRFRIAGGRAYAHVSWQVTGVRQDAYANEHRIRVEEDKPPAEGLIASVTME